MKMSEEKLTVVERAMDRRSDPTRDDSGDYIKAADFFYCQMAAMKTGEISEELGAMFHLLASRYANHSNFVRYTHIREDLISEAVAACCRDWHKFRPNRNIVTRDEKDEIIESIPVYWDGGDLEYHHTIHFSPVPYYTTVCRRAFLTVIKAEYTSRNIVNQLLIDNGLDSDEGYIQMIRDKEAREKEDKLKIEEEKRNSRSPAIEWD